MESKINYPIRIQMKRTKGFNLKEHSKYMNGYVMVSRPSKWGNPFKLIGDMIYCDASHTWHNDSDPWVLYDDRYVWSKEEGTNYVVQLYEDWIYGTIPITQHINPDIIKPCPFTIEDIKRELKGKDLVCWCPILNKNGYYVPCHADILLSLSNNLTLKNIRHENMYALQSKKVH